MNKKKKMKLLSTFLSYCVSREKSNTYGVRKPRRRMVRKRRRRGLGFELNSKMIGQRNGA